MALYVMGPLYAALIHGSLGVCSPSSQPLSRGSEASTQASALVLSASQRSVTRHGPRRATSWLELRLGTWRLSNQMRRSRGPDARRRANGASAGTQRRLLRRLLAQSGRRKPHESFGDDVTTRRDHDGRSLCRECNRRFRHHRRDRIGDLRGVRTGFPMRVPDESNR